MGLKGFGSVVAAAAGAGRIWRGWSFSGHMPSIFFFATNPITLYSTRRAFVVVSSDWHARSIERHSVTPLPLRVSVALELAVPEQEELASAYATLPKNGAAPRRVRGCRHGYGDGSVRTYSVPNTLRQTLLG